MYSRFIQPTATEESLVTFVVAVGCRVQPREYKKNAV